MPLGSRPRSGVKDFRDIMREIESAIMIGEWSKGWHLYQDALDRDGQDLVSKLFPDLRDMLYNSNTPFQISEERQGRVKQRLANMDEIIANARYEAHKVLDVLGE
jgi:hypothetical protein